MLNIQKALDERKSGYVSTLMDLKGPRITTGKNADTHREIILKKGQLLEFSIVFWYF
jgi:pyruvate kinase